MKIEIEGEAALALISGDESPDRVDRRMFFEIWCTIEAIEVYSATVGAVMTVDNSVWIQNWDKFENIVL